MNECRAVLSLLSSSSFVSHPVCFLLSFPSPCSLVCPPLPYPPPPAVLQVLLLRPHQHCGLSAHSRPNPHCCPGVHVGSRFGSWQLCSTCHVMGVPALRLAPALVAPDWRAALRLRVVAPAPVPRHSGECGALECSQWQALHAAIRFSDNTSVHLSASTRSAAQCQYGQVLVRHMSAWPGYLAQVHVRRLKYGQAHPFNGG